VNFREIPKTELHCHLEACFRPRTVMEVGKTLGLDIPQNPEVFHREWLLTRPLQNLEVALARFVDIQRIWCSPEVIERMTFEACEDAAEQGIRVMEFRYAPDFIAFGKPHLDREKIHRAILRGVKRAAGLDLEVGLIGIVQKTLTLADAVRTVDFIVDCAETFVALDFADKDTHELRAYAPMVDKARKAGISGRFNTRRLLPAALVPVALVLVYNTRPLNCRHGEFRLPRSAVTAASLCSPARMKIGGVCTGKSLRPW
jgi:adenosine deaminase